MYASSVSVVACRLVPAGRGVMRCVDWLGVVWQSTVWVRARDARSETSERVEEGGIVGGTSDMCEVSVCFPRVGPRGMAVRYGVERVVGLVA